MSIKPSLSLFVATLLLPAVAAAQHAADGDAPHAHVLEGAQLRAALSGGDTLPARTLRVPSMRVALRWDQHAPGQLEIRSSGDGLRFSEWTPVPVTWREGILHNGHVDFDRPAQRFQLRLSGGPADSLTFVYAEGIERIPDPLPEVSLPEPDIGTVRQNLGPANLVNSRSSWGARAPRCTSGHSPTKMTVHHTVTPTEDSSSPEARMRQIQAFHQDNRNWCDIGYHFVVSRDARIWQGRDERNLGTHVANANTGNVGISVMGNYEEDRPTGDQVCSVARMVDWVGRTYGISRNRSKVKGHREQGSTSCPGQHLFARLDDVIAMAGNDCSAGSTNGGNNGGNNGNTGGEGTLIGVVYRSPSTDDRITGATVRLNTGQQVTVDGNGVYRFSVAAGSYTITASASGFQEASVARDVAAGQEVWGSIGLSPSTGGGEAMGELVGFVYVEPNTSDVLAGARVRLSNGDTARTDDRGLYTFNVPVGRYTITAEADGFRDGSIDRNAVRAERVWGSIGMTREQGGGGNDRDTEAPQIRFTSPASGSVSSQPDVTVEGLVTDNVGVTSLRVGGQVATFDGRGAFSASITLREGRNRVLAVATDAAGNEAREEIELHFEMESGAGTLRGFVYDASQGAAARIEGASVRVGVGGSVLTGPGGEFEVELFPGNYLVAVQADGYVSETVSGQVTAGETTELEVGLQPGGGFDEDITPPQVTFLWPSDGDQLSGTMVEVQVQAVDDVGVTAVSVNGQVAVAEGSSTTYIANVRVFPGEQTLLARAYDAAGNAATAEIKLRVADAPGGNGGGNGNGDGNNGNGNDLNPTGPGQGGGGSGGCASAAPTSTLGLLLLLALGLRRRQS